MPFAVVAVFTATGIEFIHHFLNGIFFAHEDSLGFDQIVFQERAEGTGLTSLSGQIGFGSFELIFGEQDVTEQALLVAICLHSCIFYSHN